MALIAGVITLSLAMLLQTSIVSQITLLQGATDLVLLAVVSWVMYDRVEATWEWALLGGLLVGFVSELPFWGPLSAYCAITLIAGFIRRRVWQAPMLVRLGMVFISTFILQGISYLALVFQGVPLDFGQSFNLIMLPSALLNLVATIPAGGLIHEIARWLYPLEADEV